MTDFRDIEEARERDEGCHPDHSNVVPLRPSDAYFMRPARVRLTAVDAEYQRRARLLWEASEVPLDAVSGLFAEPIASRRAPRLEVINRQDGTTLDGSSSVLPEGGSV